MTKQNRTQEPGTGVVRKAEGPGCYWRSSISAGHTLRHVGLAGEDDDDDDDVGHIPFRAKCLLPVGLSS